jgi:hypothetical protein
MTDGLGKERLPVESDSFLEPQADFQPSVRLTSRKLQHSRFSFGFQQGALRSLLSPER